MTGWLEGIDRVYCTQHSSRRGAEVDTLVVHYSAGGGEAIRVAEYFRDRPQREASYHFVIGRDGHVIQLVALDRASWHARGIAVNDKRYRPGVNNRRSIGVCLCNRGFDVAPDTTTRLARHPKSGRRRAWEVYPARQVEALHALAMRLSDEVDTLHYVTGHEDHARGKVDPGPLLPWPQAFSDCRMIRSWNTWESPIGDATWRQISMRGSW